VREKQVEPGREVLVCLAQARLLFDALVNFHRSGSSRVDALDYISEASVLEAQAAPPGRALRYCGGAMKL